MHKVVLDTNVLVSGIIKHKRGGVPDQILGRIEHYQLFLSEEILQETERVLHYPRIQKKLNLTEERVGEYLQSLRSIAEVFTNTPRVEIIKQDPTDNAILACALKAKADFIVSGDLHLLNLKTFKNTKIIRPSEFLQLLKQSAS